MDEPSFRRANWFAPVGTERRAVAAGAGILDFSCIAKYEVSGPDAAAFLDRLSANRIPTRPGSMAVAPMLTESGRLAAFLLLTCQAPGRYYVTGPAVSELPAPDWVTLRTRLCGLCGSDYKQVFMNGGFDNPMTAVISFPQVLGHEVVSTVERVGPTVSRLRPGQRVLLNPWLSCAVRGLPLCEWCEKGELAQCRNFTRGSLTPGIHHGNSSQATGGFAEYSICPVVSAFDMPKELPLPDAGALSFPWGRK